MTTNFNIDTLNFYSCDHTINDHTKYKNNLGAMRTKLNNNRNKPYNVKNNSELNNNNSSITSSPQNRSHNFHELSQTSYVNKSFFMLNRLNGDEFKELYSQLLRFNPKSTILIGGAKDELLQIQSTLRRIKAQIEHSTLSDIEKSLEQIDSLLQIKRRYELQQTQQSTQQSTRQSTQQQSTQQQSTQQQSTRQSTQQSTQQQSTQQQSTQQQSTQQQSIQLSNETLPVLKRKNCEK